jgi:hypothetical protein
MAAGLFPLVVPQIADSRRRANRDHLARPFRGRGTWAGAAHTSLLPHIRTQHYPANSQRERAHSINTGNTGTRGRPTKGSWERCPANCACPATAGGQLLQVCGFFRRCYHLLFLHPTGLLEPILPRLCGMSRRHLPLPTRWSAAAALDKRRFLFSCCVNVSTPGTGNRRPRPRNPGPAAPWDRDRRFPFQPAGERGLPVSRRSLSEVATEDASGWARRLLHFNRNMLDSEKSDPTTTLTLRRGEQGGHYFMRLAQDGGISSKFSLAVDGGGAPQE